MFTVKDIVPSAFSDALIVPYEDAVGVIAPFETLMSNVAESANKGRQVNARNNQAMQITFIILFSPPGDYLQSDQRLTRRLSGNKQSALNVGGKYYWTSHVSHCQDETYCKLGCNEMQSVCILLQHHPAGTGSKSLPLIREYQLASGAPTRDRFERCCIDQCCSSA
jgi:hypothetical protein